MDNISKIKEAIEKALKSEPEFLGKKRLIFFENEEVDWFKKRQDVEVYLQRVHCSTTYHIHICGSEYVAGISYAVEEFLKQKLEDALISCSGTAEDDVIFITITP